MPLCTVCDTALGAAVYDSGPAVSLSSLCTVHEEPTVVFFCESCGHAQTRPLANIDAYYDKDYRILLESEEEDQLYKVVDGQGVFRAEHQARTLLGKVNLPQGARVLDYGAAKAPTLKRISAERPDIQPHVFDVSEMYKPYWDRFVPAENQAVYAPKADWEGRFDLVVSFFALEHVAEPRRFVATAHDLLKEGGVLYFLVPNMYANIGDLVVCDHINHFSAPSLRRLLADAGFADIDIDAGAHDAAFVVVARRPEDGLRPATDGGAAGPEAIAGLRAEAARMAGYWHDLADRVRTFESDHNGGRTAVYGAGFYGSFIACALADRTAIDCFVDQNPHLQSQTRFGKHIVAPDLLDPAVETVYVGLNPAVARGVIADIPAWRERNLSLFLP